MSNEPVKGAAGIYEFWQGGSMLDVLAAYMKVNAGFFGAAEKSQFSLFQLKKKLTKKHNSCKDGSSFACCCVFSFMEQLHPQFPPWFYICHMWQVNLKLTVLRMEIKHQDLFEILPWHSCISIFEKQLNPNGFLTSYFKKWNLHIFIPCTFAIPSLGKFPVPILMQFHIWQIANP